MYYFLTSHQCLIQGLRAGLQLKKRMDIHPQTVFHGQTALLGACPADPWRAAGAAGFLCGLRQPADGDWFVYLTAGGGKTALAWSVTAPGVTAACYPDLLFRHPFAELALDDGAVYAAYAVASAFFRAHRICLVTLPKDELAPSLEGLLAWLAEIDTDSPAATVALREQIAALPLTVYQKNTLTKALDRRGQTFDLTAALAGDSPPPPDEGKGVRNRWLARLLERIDGE